MASISPGESHACPPSRVFNAHADERKVRSMNLDIGFNIKGLHHFAWRCRDAEETRGFYEDVLGQFIGLSE
jgi:hypothetical protein